MVLRDHGCGDPLCDSDARERGYANARSSNAVHCSMRAADRKAPKGPHIGLVSWPQRPRHRPLGVGRQRHTLYEERIL
jgi:hypothetical protein